MLVLGKGIQATSVHMYLLRNHIKHDFLELNEVTHYNYDIVIKSPGIKNSCMYEFRKRGIKIISDIELLYLRHKKYIIGVTGTNGKTTTVSLMGHITDIKPIGNIGCPVMDYAELQDKMIIEISSFMLDNINSFRCNIAVILNLKQAHLDYYDSVIDYHSSKLRITKNLRKNDYLIYNYDDSDLRNYVSGIDCIKIPISINKKTICYSKNNKFYYKNKKIANYKKIDLIGNHNKYNVLASIATSKLLNKKNRIIKGKLYTFKNVPYRLQKIKKNIYNDSKSTNVSSTIEALKCFKNVSLICGGYDRLESYDDLKLYLKNIKIVLCYGNSRKRIEEFMLENKVMVLSFKNLNDVILYLSKMKKKNIILFSPFHSSFDQYENYVKRGLDFNYLIEKYKL